VAGAWIRLHDEELHNFYASPNIITVIMSRRLRGVEHVVRIDDEKCRKHFYGKTGKKTSLWGHGIRRNIIMILLK
jgi:hypothetical protein